MTTSKNGEKSIDLLVKSSILTVFEEFVVD